MIEIYRVARTGERTVETLGGSPAAPPASKPYGVLVAGKLVAEPPPKPTPQHRQPSPPAVDPFDAEIDALAELPDDASYAVVLAGMQRLEGALTALRMLVKAGNAATPRQSEAWFAERVVRREALKLLVEGMKGRLHLAKQRDKQENVKAFGDLNAKFREVAKRTLPKSTYDVLVATATAEFAADDGEG